MEYSMNKPEAFLKALLLKEYEDRLKTVSLLKETAVTDSKGRVVLDPDLKVRHKSSGFEYTIKKIKDDNGNISITLRTPDAPRVKPSPSHTHVIAGQEEELISMPDTDDAEFAIDQEEFEKDYEVD
ncbi:MAG: hypothetical protein CMB77_04000 [Euryarchaeota archaeon]|nr:hypothetical protein [Euryarchaeota archaeon]|tara:strand:+ start:23352 stop:23729 length:378 start_codon:yes stop_codon:yes gene_type:complete